MAIIRRGDNGGSMVRGGGIGLDPLERIRSLLNLDPFTGMLPVLGGAEPRIAGWVPAFDVRETPDSYIFKADLPGLREEDLDVQVTANRLTVSGTRREEEIQEEGTYYCAERSVGTFTRSFTLPIDVDADKVDAQLTEGVLTVHVPKQEQSRTRKITLRGKGKGAKA